MAEEVGGIYYDVDANTGQLIDSVKVVEKSNRQIGKSIDSLNAKMKGTTKAVRNASGGLGGFGRTAGQAGIQMQQLIGQIQGGQGVMLALSQQGADLGFVLGVPLAGAIAGIAASLAGIFMPSLLDSKTEMEKLEKATENLGDALKRNKEGVIEFTDEIRELAKVSEEAAKAQLAQEIIDAQNVISQAGSAIRDETGNISDGFVLAGDTAEDWVQRLEDGGKRADFVYQLLNGTIADYSGRTDAAVQSVRKLTKEFGLTEEQSIKLLGAINKATTAGDAESIQNLQNLMGEIASTTNFSNKRFIEWQGTLSKAFTEARNAGEILGVAKELMSDFNDEMERTSKETVKAQEEIRKQEDRIRSLIKTLEQKAVTASMDEKQTAVWIARQMGATDSQVRYIESLYDAIEAQESKIESDKKATAEQERAIKTYRTFKQQLTEQIAELENADQAFEDYIVRQREAAMAAGGNAGEIERMIRKLRELKQAQEEQKKAEQETKRLTGLVGTLGVTDEAQIMAQRNQQLLDLDRLKNEGLLANEQDYLNRRMEINRDAEESLQALNKKTADQQLLNWESIQNQAVGALASIATGAQDSREAIRGLAISIAQQAVGALLKMAIAGVTAQTTQAAAASATGSAIAAAYTPAAIAANIASFGGAATAAAATAPLASAATQAAINIGGGRLYGGGVSPDKIYPVTENGKPELFQSGNKSYLLPGSRGNVVSNKDMQGGAANVNIQVNVQNNMAGAAVDVQSRSTGSGVDAKQVLDIVVNDVNSRGRVHKAITSTTSANNKTT